MTTDQLHLFNGLYLLALVIVAFLTRATARRIAGACAGGAAMGVECLVVIALCDALGLWRFTFPRTPYFVLLVYLGLAISGAPIFLVTWRIARRFGWRGLAVVLVAAAAIGPPRDYWWMSKFPEWGSYAPGVAPGLAIAATYVTMVALGHAVMRLVAGPAGEDRLAQRPWVAS